ncbi:PilW family protein [Demequina lutea]|uniref:Prepilin-type N-terminal cleavage/methylation domain-containing protein n=1 Tax=Demequina lutea TaxID=431489 RepID=A0A7Y9ZB70_9MICO|nr:prepilin-type N-terminal cleavage/methylation domain-containing protein [Demequina lutea]NYI41358.1 prepilin-type N-terminal cleavage/methylation domain-containing protein [Demequina lutea]
MSSLLTRLRAALRREESDDSGLTIIELVVAMSIFTIVLAIYFSALISMSKTTVQAQGSVDASDALRATFNVLDHEVRYASSINTPGQGASGAWYAEFEATDLPQKAFPMCYQWRLDPNTHVLSTRTWTEDGTSAPTAWHGVSWNVQAGGGASPFTLTPAVGTVLRQSLTVHLTVKGPAGAQLADQETTFIARNSSSASKSDLVCTAGMSRP